MAPAENTPYGDLGHVNELWYVWQWENSLVVARPRFQSAMRISFKKICLRIKTVAW
jgi:hypothetical protein